MRPAPCGYSSACVLRPYFLFSFRKGNGVARQRKRGPRKTGSASRAAIASEEASSIPFPPGRRKLHIRSLLLPSQIVTVSLGHNLAIWNFTTPHAILMMAGRRLLSDTVKTETFLRRKSRARLWSMESPENHPKGSLVVSFFSSRCDTVLFFLRIEKEKNGVAKFVSFSEGVKEMVSRKMQAANGFPYDEHSKCTTKSRPALWPGGMLLF